MRVHCELKIVLKTYKQFNFKFQIYKQLEMPKRRYYSSLEN